MGKQMTYSQKKRAKLDYRAVYFSHNPGLFGCIWFCAYCKKPIVGKQNVQEIGRASCRERESINV